MSSPESMKPRTPEKREGPDVSVATQRVLSIRPEESNARGIAEMLLNASSVEDFKRMTRERRFQSDFEQTLLPIFRNLFNADPGVKATTIQELQNLEVEDEIIKEYFTGMGNVPTMILRIKYHKEKEHGWAEPFIEKAREVIFKTLKAKISEA